MDIKRFVTSDIRRAVIHNKYRILLCAGIISALMITFYTYAAVNPSIKDAGLVVSFYDYILYMIRGSVRVTTQNINKLEIPYVWISLCIMNDIMVLDYMYNDCRGIGRNVLVYSNKKSVWWLSKCVTTAVSVSIVYILIYLSAMIFAIIGKGGMSGIHTEVFRILYPKDTALMTPDMVNGMSVSLLVYVVLFPWIISVSIGLFQLTLCLYTGPVLSFVIIIMLEGLSVFSNNILLPGNWLMAERSSILAYKGHNIYIMLLMSVILGIISVIAGNIKFKKSDIL